MAKDGTWSIDTHYFDYQSALNAVKQETLADKFMIMHVEEYRYYDGETIVKIEKLIQRAEYEPEEPYGTVALDV
jgi:hypothetical protein